MIHSPTEIVTDCTRLETSDEIATPVATLAAPTPRVAAIRVIRAGTSLAVATPAMISIATPNPMPRVVHSDAVRPTNAPVATWDRRSGWA
jgi:hypothetical protein